MKKDELVSCRAVGVFDSGVGGISVLKHIRQLLPAEDLLYCADSRFAPYGNKSPEVIRERATYLANFLIAQGAKALVVACNTATAAAIEHLRGKYSLPIIGMEPAVKPAVKATKTGVVGVLATSGTLKSAQFAALLESYGQEVKIVTEACIGLVECIERGELDTPETRGLLKRYIDPLLAAGADTVVLGCTHYPFVVPLIAELAGSQITLIDTGAAVARQLRKRLEEAGLLNTGQAEGKNLFWLNRENSHELQQSTELVAKLWGGEGQVVPLPVSAKYMQEPTPEN
ncbi:MAG TPA: glutamate racemase [Methylophilaceae bacterium]|jgi:glutamate racemase